jgi:hypothetical protein
MAESSMSLSSSDVSSSWHVVHPSTDDDNNDNDANHDDGAPLPTTRLMSHKDKETNDSTIAVSLEGEDDKDGQGSSSFSSAAVPPIDGTAESSESFVSDATTAATHHSHLTSSNNNTNKAQKWKDRLAMKKKEEDEDATTTVTEEEKDVASVGAVTESMDTTTKDDDIDGGNGPMNDHQGGEPQESQAPNTTSSTTTTTTNTSSKAQKWKDRLAKKNKKLQLFDDEVQQISTMDTEESAADLMLLVVPATTTSTASFSEVLTDSKPEEGERETLVHPSSKIDDEDEPENDEEIVPSTVGEAAAEINPEDPNEHHEMKTTNDIVMPTGDEDGDEDATRVFTVVPAIPPPPSSEERTSVVGPDEGENLSRTVSFGSPTGDSSWNDELDQFSSPPPRSLSTSASTRAISMDSSASAMIPEDTFENEFEIPSVDLRLERSMSRDSTAIPEEVFENEFDAENDTNLPTNRRPKNDIKSVPHEELHEQPPPQGVSRDLSVDESSKISLQVHDHKEENISDDGDDADSCSSAGNSMVRRRTRASRASSMLIPDEQFDNEYDPTKDSGGDGDDDDNDEKDPLPPTYPFPPMMVIGVLVVGVVAILTMTWLSSSGRERSCRRRPANYYGI